MVIVGNACGAERLGIYSVGFSIVLLAMAIESSIVSTPFTVHSQSDREENAPARAGSSLFNLLLVSGLVAGLQLVGVAISYFFVAAEYFGIFLIVIVVSPMVMARTYMRRYLLARHRSVRLLVLDTFGAGAQLALLAYFAQQSQLTPNLAMSLVGLVNLATFLLFMVLALSEFDFNPSDRWRQIGEDWSFGKWLVGEQMLAIVSVYGSPWLLAVLLDSHAVGVFAACSSITGLANPFLLGLGNYLLPQLSREYVTGGHCRNTYRQYLTLVIVVVSAFVLFCFLFADQLLATFYRNDSYDGFGMVFAIMSTRTLFSSLGLVAHWALLAMKKPKFSLFASICNISVQLVLSLILIPAWGLIGAALAWTLASIVESSFMVISFQWVEKNHVERQMVKGEMSGQESVC